MQPNKAELRHKLKQKRQAIAPVDRQELSRSIRANLVAATDWADVNTVHCFEPIENMGEVDVQGFIEGKQVFTSRLVDGQWQIVALDDTNKVPNEFDAIIVPMLGFDASLNRIGYGGGYYDRLLARQPTAKKIGVCFEAGKVEQIPVEPHDVPLDMIVTESAIYTPDSTPKGV